jgi:hypothetical protein
MKIVNTQTFTKQTVRHLNLAKEESNVTNTQIAADDASIDAISTDVLLKHFKAFEELAK